MEFIVAARKRQLQDFNKRGPFGDHHHSRQQMVEKIVPGIKGKAELAAEQLADLRT